MLAIESEPVDPRLRDGLVGRARPGMFLCSIRPGRMETDRPLRHRYPWEEAIA